MNPRLLAKIGTKTFENMNLPSDRENKIYLETGQYLMGLFDGTKDVKDIPEDSLKLFARIRLKKDIINESDRTVAKATFSKFFEDKTKLHGHLGRVLFMILQDHKPDDDRLPLFNRLINSFDLNTQYKTNISLLNALKEYYPDEKKSEEFVSARITRNLLAAEKLTKLLKIDGQGQRCEATDDGIDVHIKSRSAAVRDPILSKIKAVKSEVGYSLGEACIKLLMTSDFTNESQLSDERDARLSAAAAILKKYLKGQIKYLDTGVSIVCFNEATAQVIARCLHLTADQDSLLVPYFELFALEDHELNALHYQLSPELHPTRIKLTSLCKALADIIPDAWTRLDGNDLAIDVHLRVAAVIKYVNITGLVVNEACTEVKMLGDDLPAMSGESIVRISESAVILLKKIEMAANMVSLLDKKSPHGSERHGLSIQLENEKSAIAAKKYLGADMIQLDEHGKDYYYIPYASILACDYHFLQTQLFALSNALTPTCAAEPVKIKTKQKSDNMSGLFNEPNLLQTTDIRRLIPKASTKSTRSNTRPKPTNIKANKPKPVVVRNVSLSEESTDAVTEDVRRKTLLATDIFADRKPAPRAQVCLFTNNKKESYLGNIEEAFLSLVKYRRSQNTDSIKNCLRNLAKLLKSAPDAHELNEQVIDFLMCCNRIDKRITTRDDLLAMAATGIKLWDAINTPKKTQIFKRH